MIVLDTNVVVSAILSPGGNPARLLLAVFSGDLYLSMSTEIEAEYLAVLRRPVLGLKSESIAQFEAMLPLQHWPEIPARPDLRPLLPDPTDLPFIEAALATPGHILITGNTKHYPPEAVAPVRVLTPRQAVQELYGLQP